MNAIEMRGLTKKFNGFTAVDSISLDIREGEIFGLLGPNGAGKTTTISMLSTILAPTSGSAKVWGHDIVGEKDAVRKSIGIVFQDPSLDDELTGRENMDFHGRLYDIDGDTRGKRITELLKLVDLEKHADKQVKTYSGGMKRRLEIARGLMHKPKVLFLDEPTLGLDPQTRRKLWDYIKDFNRKEKVTIILTTHYMEEADFLCGRVAIVDQGKIIRLDTPEKLKELLGGDILSIEVSDPKKLSGLLKKASLARNVQIVGSAMNVIASNGSRTLPKIIELACKNGIEVNTAVMKRPSLEDVFIHYTGRGIREQEAEPKRSARMRMRPRGH
ncbi:MAG: ATP-binding cassette domain-containing protein [Candidatus Micrarchaeota archaeon]|nr:ATP-binding cassette domain-containing protein [Candidatus Micrarchaeota archaeon]